MTNPDHASSAARAMRRLRLTTTLGGAALLLLSTATVQAAITPSSVDPWQHIVDCAQALFANPAEHAQFCSPGPEPVDFKSNFVWTTVNPPPPPPPSSSEQPLPLD